MLSLDLTTGESSLFDVLLQVKRLKSEELFYLRLNSIKPSDDEKTLILTAARFSKEVFVSIPVDDFLRKELRDELFSYGVKGFSLRVTVEVDKYLRFEGRGSYLSGDQELIQRISNYLQECPVDKKLAVEFQLTTDYRLLPPTMVRLHELGVQWMVLNPEGSPDRYRCQIFRELFEYLKMRGCNYLNVYFPFWNPYFKEWDVKTGNTFAGLQEVHIDLSNRCTHSCVFCSLYGPMAIEDWKKETGSISESVLNFMKLEIETEQCLSIIQSLPWSVEVVQFGGAGDPLMHPDALKIISTARSRGFKVSVLSNMEYLDEEKIQALHELGGYSNQDMYFDANVSGGTADVYLKTRPKQNEKAFDKIISNLSLLSKLRRENNGFGVNFSVMCVVTTMNCLNLLDVAKLAHKIGATGVWFKPMEIHAPYHDKLIPSGEGFRNSLKEALQFADEVKMPVIHRQYCERILLNE